MTYDLSIGTSPKEIKESISDCDYSLLKVISKFIKLEPKERKATGGKGTKNSLLF